MMRARAAAPSDARVFQLLLDVYLAKRPPEQAAFAERALAALESGEDAELLWLVGRTVQPRNLGQRMMERAKELEPEIADRPEKPRRIFLDAGEPGPKLILKVEPAYPAEARAARIQGDVRFNVVIDGKGQVASFQVPSGDPMLLEAALDVLKKWRYEPTVVNGVAVEVATQVAVPFRLAQ